MAMMSLQELFYGDCDPSAYLVHYGRQQLVPVMQVPHSRSSQYMVPIQRYSTQRCTQSRPNNSFPSGRSTHAAQSQISNQEGIATDADRSNGTASRVTSNAGVSTHTRICCPGHTTSHAITLIWHPAPIATVTVVESNAEEEIS